MVPPALRAAGTAVSCHLLFDYSVRGCKRKAMSQPIITPRKFLHAIYGRDALPPEVAGCTCAVVAFCQFRDMQYKLAAEPVPTSLFSLLHQTHQFIGHVAGRTILALENLQGGPLAATVIEELAHYGITQVLGYGYAGSLTRTVPIGQLVLAEDALISDGTSRAYLPQEARVTPDDALVHELRTWPHRWGLCCMEQPFGPRMPCIASIQRRWWYGGRVTRRWSIWTRRLSMRSVASWGCQRPMRVWCPTVSKLPPGMMAIRTLTMRGERSKTSSSRHCPE